MGEFGALRYTDCRAGEGLLGRDGLQFRAVSPGVSPGVEVTVERHCLYEPPGIWMRENRPVRGYPRSLAHIVDGVYATAGGTYLGTEVKGDRAGNQFTHAIVTEDPGLYGQVRPAQLWGSPVWTARYRGPTTCPPCPADPPPGPLDPETVQRWVAGRPDGENMLVAVLSALTEAKSGGRRVVFVASRPDPVLSWIAAATLLMPQADALRVGFKVYVNNAEYSAHHAVALHPDWAGPYLGAPDGTAFTVFDLDAGARSPVTRDEAAVYWARRFLTRDCFDVLDAVELSGSLRADAATPVAAAERFVAAAAVLGEPLDDAAGAAVVAWLGVGADRLSAASLRTLIGALLAGPLTLDQLDVLRRVAAANSAEVELSRRILGRAIGVVTGEEVAVPDDGAAATATLERSLAAAPARELPDLLSLAGRHGLSPDPTAFRASLLRFAAWWADGGRVTPGAHREWPCRDVVIDLLRDALLERLHAGVGGARAVGDTWWELLLPTVADHRSPLDAALSAAAVRSGDDRTRAAVSDSVLSALAAAPGPDAAAVAWDVLHRDRPPTVAQMGRVLDLAGVGPLPAHVADGIDAALDALPGPEPAAVRVVDRLTAFGRPPVSPRVAQWHAQMRVVRKAAAQLAELPATVLRPPSDEEARTKARTDLHEHIDAVATDLGTAEPAVAAALGGEVMAALRRPHPRHATAFVRALPPPHRADLLRSLVDEIAGGHDDRLAATAFLLVYGPDQTPDDLWRRLVEQRRTRPFPDDDQVADLLVDEDGRPDEALRRWWAQDPAKPPGRRLFRRQR